MDEYRLHPSLVTHWRAGVLEPWPDAKAATETVWLPLPEGTDGVRYWEGLNGRLEPDGTVTVLGVPAYAYDLNLGDRVAVVRSPKGSFVATGITHDAGNYTFRFFLLDPDDKTAWYPLAQEFAAVGCLIDVLSPHLTALSCVPKASQSVADRLAQLEEQGTLQYETGRTINV
ncbi:DUF4265 domain-containing protein [Arthrobacter sp. AZCC_0090]|uniref:DUF4265 domain-containing protein n=1 Tax=Arthrobacter sp. AZCC_0090 TaxID=2735881 RepID=UPI0016160E14|nr:DUF4265 domain-containing protein [Arthrobacter sp. AZCC_0090]MBB6405639.1 hypothetical protein [Arthrobacter sp. AZCC_0090]